MSEENRNKTPPWFAHDFPIEWYFTEKLVENFAKVFHKMPPDSLLGFVKNPNLFSRRPDMIQDNQTHAHLDMNPYFLMFFGILSTVIFDTIKEFQEHSSEMWTDLLMKNVKEKLVLDYPDFNIIDMKKCSNCQTENTKSARFCNSCGSRFS